LGSVSESYRIGAEVYPGSHRRPRKGGVDLIDRGLVADREPNRLDELAVGFSRVLSWLDIDHVFVAGYVAILAGRSEAGIAPPELP
jgi:hypothetical protein